MPRVMLRLISISGRQQSFSSKLGGLGNKAAVCVPLVNMNRFEIPGDLPCNPRGSQGISRGLGSYPKPVFPGDLQGISSLSPLDLGIPEKRVDASVKNSYERQLAAPRSSSLAGVILAAGASSRMGQDKALLQYGGISFLAGAIRVLRNICDFVVVVAGKNLDILRQVVYENSAYLVLNRHPELGQFSSLRLGLQAVLNRGRDAACVTLVDRPPAEAKTVQRLKEHFLRSSPETTWAVVPQFGGKHGHPVIFGREMIEVILRAQPTDNAREIEHQHQSRIAYLEVDDSRVVLNINTPEDYSSLQTPR